jgi:hypothetical protein
MQCHGRVSGKGYAGAGRLLPDVAVMRGLAEDPREKLQHSTCFDETIQ